MYRRILVGFDGHAASRDALTLAHGLAALEHAELVLATCLENLDPLATPAHAYERATAEAEYRLSESARQILGETRFRFRIVGGVSAPRGLHELAEDEGADVVVLGSTQRGGLGKVLPGSVAERLLHGAPCAVMVAPKGFARRSEPFTIRSIGVGYDGRTESTHAREVAGGLAEELGASVTTITAGEGEGEPATILAERSRELDLLVVGSRGYGPVGAVLLGSTSSHLAHTASCPVLVTPRDTRFDLLG